MANKDTPDKDASGILGTNERLIRKLHPHVLSFFRYYAIGVVLLIWTVVLTMIVLWDYPVGFEDLDWFGKDLNPMLPIILWAVMAALLGISLVRGFMMGFQVLYWISIVLGVVLTALFIWYWDMKDFAPRFALIYGYVDGLVTILVAELYRRAFSYYISDLRIVIRYKLLSSKEVNLRFEKIEDWKITRSLSWRILGVGTIRPYTGTEDGKADLNRAFDAPDECLYGIWDPENIKKLLVDLVLERDQIRGTVETPVVEVPKKKKGREPEIAVEPAPEPVPEPVQAEPEAQVSYYQPAPVAAPAPTRNYERVNLPQESQDDMVIPPPGPSADDDEDEDTEKRPVRTMYPEAKEPSSELQLEDLRSMDFEQPRPSSAAPKKMKKESEEDDAELYDDSRPRSL
jgi:hypothetical protein